MRLDVAFDLDFSLGCGQVFRWRKIGGWWYGVVGDKVIKIRQCGSDLEFEGANEGFVRQYFGLNDNLKEISRCISKDSYIQAALKRFEGLRIVRQVPWECLSSFICATYKSIAAIELMLRKISEKYGEKRVFDGCVFHTFPSARKLAGVSEEGLLGCGLGYRAKYLQATAKKVVEEEIDLEAFRALPYLDARRRLLEFSGVGLKVADCVLLFSLEKPEAFPVDVWVKRVILNHYADKFPQELVAKMKSHNSLTNGEYIKIGDFARSYFGCYAGYAQEYLFHYERTQH
ncbi:MAG: 8-oxoguanine DNA glycosylase [Candidatus Bathyarchaeota archaeon]|nr:8-oxoguanine DNA glycosylase [Candidatus Bathyarchaeota archaeon]